MSYQVHKISNKPNKAICLCIIRRLCPILVLFSNPTPCCFGSLGMYGTLGYGEDDLNPGNAILIIMQLFFAGVIVIILDELLQKGYGLGSGMHIYMRHKNYYANQISISSKKRLCVLK